MNLKASVWGRGLAALLGVGAVILAALDKEAWKIFLAVAFLVWVIPVLKNWNKSSKRRRKR